MHFRALYGCLLLVPFLSSSLAYTDQGVLAQWDNFRGIIPSFEDIVQEVKSSLQRPHTEKPHKKPTEPVETIYEHLANDPKFSLITKALNFVEDIGALLNDSSAELTFFAPPDVVLRRPPGAPPRRNDSFFERLGNGGNIEPLSLFSEFRDLTEFLPLLEELEHGSSVSTAGDDDDDDDDRERRKKIFKIILRGILSYHILPGAAYDIATLGQNITYPTKLQISSTFDGEPLRLRVGHTLIPPATHVNFFTRIVHADVKATNGIIHVVNHPLLPPPSVFQELYLVPRFFSTLTSALQRSNLTDNTDLRYIHGYGLKGTTLVTVFAPTNKAFESLPHKLQLFLFSPLGERALKKLLQYHIVPDAVIHSNYVHGNIATDPMYAEEDAFNHPAHINHAKPKLPRPEPIFVLNMTLDTLFENHTISTQVIQNRVTFPKLPRHKKQTFVDTKVIVNKRPAIVTDVVSLNGAIHIIDQLLDPRKDHHHHCGHHHHGRHPGHHGEREDQFEHGSPHPWNRESIPEVRGRKYSPRRHAKVVHEKTPDYDGPGHQGNHGDCQCRNCMQRPNDNINVGIDREWDDWVDWESWLPQWAEQD